MPFAATFAIPVMTSRGGEIGPRGSTNMRASEPRQRVEWPPKNATLSARLDRLDRVAKLIAGDMMRLA